jgi:uncharacterized protein (TIGR02646 family)
MITVTRPPLPEVLKQHQSEWTKELMNLVKKYGGYDKIPDGEKQTAVNKYRHDDIKRAIQKMFHGKCVFCESIVDASGDIHIEHFYPKSLYPECTFEWENLFPACKKCNNPKGDYDTDTYPIVNPERDDPEKCFVYRDVRIHPAPDLKKGQRTIEVCDLHRIELFWPMARILGQFYETEKGLKETVSKYSSLTQTKKKRECLSKIHDALENMKALAADTEPYAGFLRYVLRNSPVVRKAMELINEHREELGS